ncbi:MAG TPA: helicase-associated domain-containing protein [Acidimicrobiales bacterium]|nr:helicase-associated domain-containing protein [Acidimicrobiales bacterium]
MTASITSLRSGGLELWASSLARASDEELAALFELRPDLRLPPPASFAALAQEVISPASALRCLDLLDRSARQAAEALCVLGDRTAAARLAAALGCAAPDIATVRDRLVAARLALLDGPEVIVNPGLRTAVRHPARLGRPAAGMLAAKTSKELGEIARRLGLHAPRDKGSLLELLSEALGDRQVVAAVLAGGPEGTEQLARRVAGAGPMLELGYSYSSYERHDSDRAPSGWLLRRGLLVSTSWGVAEMPAEVAVALRGGLIYPAFSPRPPELATSPVDAAGVDAEASHAALRLVADAVALLDALGAVPAKLLKGGGLGVRELRRLAKVIGRDETETARLVELCGQGDLVGIDREELVALPAPGFDRFLALSSAVRWGVLAGAWLAAHCEVSIAGAEDAEGKPVPALLQRGPDDGAAARRRVLASLLVAVPPGVGADPASMAELADWQAPALFALGPARAARLVGWQLAESALLGITAQGAPSSFGRLLLAGDAAAAVERLTASAPPVVDEIVVQADMTVIAAGELPFELRAELELLADVESSGAATVFRFSEASLRRGLDAGRSSADILALLERHARRGVPQSLSYLIEDLGRRYGKVRVGAAACYVRCDDPSLVAELLAARRLAKLGLRALAPTVLAASAGSEAVITALRDAGYLAAGEEADGTLSIRRPPARRAARGMRESFPYHGFGDIDLDGDLEIDLDELGLDPEDLDELDLDGLVEIGPERLAQLFGEAGPALLAAMTRHARPPAPPAAARGGTGGGDSSSAELRDLITRLRQGPAAPARGGGDPAAGRRGGPPAARQAPAGRGTPGGPGATGRAAPGPHAAGAGRLFGGEGDGSDEGTRRHGWESHPARPSQFAKGAPALTSLLEQAVGNDWAVRLCWRDEDAPTFTREAYAYPVEVRRGLVHLELPDDEALSLPIAQLVWARVLTEAEEVVAL